MWGGVISGLACLKFSGSLNIYGCCKLIVVRVVSNRANPSVSLMVNRG